MDLGLTGRVIVITGAGRGIGAETAMTLAREGAAVAVLDLDGDAAREIADLVGKEGGRATGIACDVTRADAVEQAFDAAVQALGPVDVLVNNAGFTKDRSILKMQEDEWDSVIAVNLKGAYNCCRAVLPGMRERRWGRIINLSSRSVFGNPGQTNYSAAKAGVIGFTRALSLEHAKYGVTVNAIAPGFIETQGMREIANYPALREAALAKNPVGFLGQPKDIAATVAFVASEQARYMTGTTLFVTGGRYSS